jgi:hypothetical protein
VVTGSPAVIRLGGGQLLLRGPAVIDLWRLANNAAQMASRRDGIVLSPTAKALLAALQQEAALAMSACPPADVRDAAPLSLSAEDQLTTEEVSHMMNLSSRQVRRCAASLGARRIAGRWAFDRSAVAQYLAGKAA